LILKVCDPVFALLIRVEIFQDSETSTVVVSAVDVHVTVKLHSDPPAGIIHSFSLLHLGFLFESSDSSDLLVPVLFVVSLFVFVPDSQVPLVILSARFFSARHRFENVCFTGLHGVVTHCTATSQHTGAYSVLQSVSHVDVVLGLFEQIRFGTSHPLLSLVNV
jgi:hypothetical protein